MACLTLDCFVRGMVGVELTNTPDRTQIIGRHGTRGHLSLPASEAGSETPPSSFFIFSSLCFSAPAWFFSALAHGQVLWDLLSPGRGCWTDVKGRGESRIFLLVASGLGSAPSWLRVPRTPSAVLLWSGFVNPKVC